MKLQAINEIDNKDDVIEVFKTPVRSNDFLSNVTKTMSPKSKRQQL